ncbi:hypothetical protein V8D89_003545 [Ganoderma adspersum]
MSYKKSNVTGRTWSTPFNTPFFIQWGEWSVKVPMDHLREEYNAWEELQHDLEQEDLQTEREARGADPFPSSTSSAFDWAEDVEQELFSDNSTSNLHGEPDADRVDSPIVHQGTPGGLAVDGAGTTSLIGPGEGREEDVRGEDEATVADATTPTSSSDVDNRVYRVIKVSTTGNAPSIHMVEDAGIVTTDDSMTAQRLSEVIQFLAGVGLLKLDTYATVFDTAARGCASGDPFWLDDPACGYQIVV